MSSPSSRTSPARLAPGTSSCIRLRMRRNVDLPQPDGPMSAVTRPAGMVRVTSSSTWCSPNQALTRSATSVAGWPSVTDLVVTGRVRVPSLPSIRVIGASQGVREQEGEVLEDLPEDREQDGHGPDPQPRAGAPDGEPGDGHR